MKKTGFKNAVRSLVAALACVLASIPAPGARSAAQACAAAPEGAVRLPILMYHSVLRDPARWGTYVIGVQELENDLRYLRDNGYAAVTVEDLIRHVHGEAKLPDKPVMITFDDGYYNNYLYAYPLLKKYNMRAVVSIIGRYSDQYSLETREDPAYSHITWAEAREMADSGTVELQNHSYNLHIINHERTASMRVSGESMEHYESVLVADAIRLQALIQNYTGQAPTCYTYPFGLVSRESVGILRDEGFQASLSCYQGINNITRDPECLYLMKRLLRPHGKSAQTLLEHYMH